jgi:hypothetical protein
MVEQKERLDMLQVRYVEALLEADRRFDSEVGWKLIEVQIDR